MYVLLGVIIVIILGILLHDYFPQIQMFFHPNQRAEAVREIHQHGVIDALLFLVVLTIATMFPGFPYQVICVFAGICFGDLGGTIINVIGLVLGGIGSVILIDYVRGMASSFSNRQLKFSHFKYPFLLLCIGYAIPFFPIYLISYEASRLKLSRPKLVTAILIGSIPQSLIYTFGGLYIINSNLKTIVGILVLVILFIIVLNVLIKHFTKKNTVSKAN